MRSFAFLLLVFLSMTILTPDDLTAQQISFWETFALSEDRDKALERLVPGSEDYYFFHCLHAQNEGDLDEVESLLKRWIKAHGATQQVRVIENRQALLKYGEDPKATLDHLKRQLNLDFNHQRQIPQAQKDLPTSLAARLIDQTKIVNRYLSQDSNSLRNFDDVGLRYLVDKPLNTRQRRELLKRISDPTFPGVLGLIAKDLKAKDGKRFGDLKIHRSLTKSQLETLSQELPQLKSQKNFVDEYIRRLRPSADVNLSSDNIAYRDHLDRLWAWVKELGPTFNSLKVNVLYRLLELDQRENRMDRQRFVEYLQFPRNASYINRKLTEGVRRDRVAALSENYSKSIRSLPINNDEPLVRDYLHHFLADAANSKVFAKFFEDDYLKKQFATAKILAGNGDREQWASMLSPSEYQNLLERIDLDFAPSNKTDFGVADVVELELFTKNVDKLIVKVFEINTRNFYRKFGKEIDTDISLDGLVANEEQLHEYDDSPLLRKSRKFRFDKLDQRGVYVIDFIGGGKSSRALIRKGRLQVVGRITAIGQRFSVVNESGAVVDDASMTIGGRNYAADKDGYIDVPFSANANAEKAIISQGEFSCLQVVQSVREEYSLRSAFHVDRESLAKNNEATVIVRPSLSLAGGNPVPLSRLKSCKLEIISTTFDGNTSTKTITDFAVSELEESTATFRVPPRLRTIAFRIEATLDTLLKQEKTLSASRTFSVNNIDTTEQIVDLHLLPTLNGYFLEVLGRSGERRAGQPVRILLKVDGIVQPVSVDLQSDENGLIQLGDLSHIENLQASIANGTQQSWDPNPQRMQLESVYHILSEQQLMLPLPESDLTLDPAWVTLLEVRSGRNVRDCFEKLSIDGRRLQVSKLEPGDYQLQIRNSRLLGSGNSIMIRVTEGAQAGSTLVGKHRMLKQHNPTQPFAESASIAKDKLQITIADAKETTRVHVYPVRYLNEFDPFADLNLFRGPQPWTLSPAIRNAAYMAGRKIGEEYQYILDRRYASQYPGNMLERPSLLMNPWAVQETTNEVQSAKKGEAASRSGVVPSAAPKSAAMARQQGGSAASFANLGFLGGGQDAILNLKPDEDGTIELTSEQIGNAQSVRIVVVDLFSVTQTSIMREPISFKPVDQRLANALDPKKHFRQSRQIETLAAGDSLVIEDVLSAQFQQYDELADVYSLYKSIGKDTAKLDKFRFVLSWLEKTPEQKRELYSEHACHELNFWLFKKDNAFFTDVVRKHLLNKRERTFMDRWLLEEDLSEFLAPWQFARLNIVEKILLSQRHADRFDDMVRHVNELYDLNPTTRDQFDQLYDKSLMSRRLSERYFDTDDDGLIENEELDRASLPELARSAGQGQGFQAFSAPNVASMGMGGMGGRGMGPGGVAMGMKVDRDEISLGRAKKGKAVPRSRVETRSRFVDGKEQKYTVEVPFTETPVEYFSQDMISGKQVAALYRRVEPTREWIENNYYKLLPSAQNSGLVAVNQFWMDYANHETGSFASRWFAEANGNFTEMMFALAVLDLPLKEVDEKIDIADGKMTITAESPMIVLHQQNEEAEFDRKGTTVFVSENFYQTQNRYRYENGIKFDKFVQGKFLANVLYGSEVVITNPTSTPMAIELLIQIPQGAVPVNGSLRTKSVAIQLNAFSTRKFEYSFYFPTAGDFTHYPAHVSNEVKVLAVAENRDFQVVAEPAVADKDSWAWISQNGSEEEVIDFLDRENVQRIDLTQIAFRMKDKTFFLRATDTLRQRYRYDHTLWAYAVRHNDSQSIAEFVTNADRITSHCGAAFESELLTIDPFERKLYEHREFSPLINSRAHKLGAKQTILNDRFRQQYEKLMEILGHRKSLDSDSHLVVTYYMLLQDRIDDALMHFGKIDSAEVAQSMSYAYCDAYLDLYRGNPDEAKAKAMKWVKYPVDRWRKKFEGVVAMVDEIQGVSVKPVDETDRTQQQDQLASSAPGFEFEIKSAGAKRGAGKGVVDWRNVDKLTINYYQMDIEFLFSSNPFARDQIDGFSMIRPNLSETVELKSDETEGTYEFELADQFANKNVLVEVIAGDDSKSKTWYANSMEVQVVETYGQVLLSDPESGKPISKAYVKVFSKDNRGRVQFHKDGYTDLRGRFDYVTQSNRSLNGIADYAILIMSDEKGAVIREAKPPRE